MPIKEYAIYCIATIVLKLFEKQLLVQIILKTIRFLTYYY